MSRDAAKDNDNVTEQTVRQLITTTTSAQERAGVNAVKIDFLNEKLDDHIADVEKQFDQVRGDIKETNTSLADLHKCVHDLDKKNTAQHAEAQVKQLERHTEVLAKIDHIVVQQENAFSTKFWKFFNQHPKITIIGFVVILGALGVQIGGLDINAMITSFMGVSE